MGGVGGGIVGGGKVGGGKAGGGNGGPTVIVAVTIADSGMPSELARVEGVSAEAWAAAKACASDEDAKPLLTTVTAADTVDSWTVGVTAGTPSVVATFEELIVGAVRSPPLVALSSRVTVKDALV